MANNFRTIYLYIVCLITLCMFVGGIVSTVNSIVSYFYPDSYVFFDDSVNTPTYDPSYSYSDIRNTKIQQDNYKKERIKNALVSVAVLFLGSTMYKYHWNLIEKERIS